VTARPWRAAAYLSLGGGLRLYRARTSAKTRKGLEAFVERWRDQGCVVEEWEVLPHPAVLTLVERHQGKAALR
jgi:hypothetical protein